MRLSLKTLIIRQNTGDPYKLGIKYILYSTLECRHQTIINYGHLVSVEVSIAGHYTEISVLLL
jgi:hypothetical protein